MHCPVTNDDSSLAFWIDEVDPTSYTGKGRLARPSDCAMQRTFAEGVDYWFSSGNRFVVTHDVRGARATLSTVGFGPGGAWPSGGRVVVQQSVDRSVGLLLPALDVAVFTLSMDVPGVPGLYVLRLP